MVLYSDDSDLPRLFYIHPTFYFLYRMVQSSFCGGIGTIYSRPERPMRLNSQIVLILGIHFLDENSLFAQRFG